MSSVREGGFVEQAGAGGTHLQPAQLDSDLEAQLGAAESPTGDGLDPPHAVLDRLVVDKQSLRRAALVALFVEVIAERPQQLPVALGGAAQQFAQTAIDGHCVRDTGGGSKGV